LVTAQIQPRGKGATNPCEPFCNFLRDVVNEKVMVLKIIGGSIAVVLDQRAIKQKHGLVLLFKVGHEGVAQGDLGLKGFIK